MSLESQERLNLKDKLPIGDLFEQRKLSDPIITVGQMAAGINEQVPDNVDLLDYHKERKE